MGWNGDGMGWGRDGYYVSKSQHTIHTYKKRVFHLIGFSFTYSGCVARLHDRYVADSIMEMTLDGG